MEIRNFHYKERRYSLVYMETYSNVTQVVGDSKNSRVKIDALFSLIVGNSNRKPAVLI